MKKDTPFFSIVMPVYNVEKYLKEAVDSVLLQTFTDFELIFVNDCSTDASGIIANQLTDVDSRIKVINHLQNYGLSAARNSGLQQAHGRYIFFMDSDDTVDFDLLQKVYESLCENPAELVVFGLVEEYFNQSGKLIKKHIIIPESILTSSESEVREKIIHLEDYTLLGYAWNKIYSLDVIKKNNYIFENITLIEDIVFNTKYCSDLSSINIISIAPYHYKKRGSASLTNKYVPDYFKLHQKRVEIILQLYEDWNLVNSSVLQILGRIYTRYIYSAIVRNMSLESKMSLVEQYKWCMSIFNDQLYQILVKENYHPRNLLNKILLFPLRYQNAFILIIFGYCIHFIKSSFRIFFINLKNIKS